MEPKNTELLSQLSELIIHYRKEKDTRNTKTQKKIDTTELSEILALDIPELGSTDNDIIEFLRTYLDYAVDTSHPQYYNALWAGFNTAAFAGETIAGLTNTSMYTYEVAPVATLIERFLIQKMGKLAGFQTPGGQFVPGGSYGNMLGLLCARHQKWPESKKYGTPQNINPVILVSDQSHYSFTKAANLMGLGSNAVIKIQTTKDGSMIPKKLKEKIQELKNTSQVPFCIVATAGTTVRGGFDPIDQIATIAEQHDIWLHVDGSWGASVLLHPEHRKLMTGIRKADSLQWNPHKMMGIPLQCAAFIIQDQIKMTQACAVGDTSYLFYDDAAPDLGPHTLACGRRNDSLKLYTQWLSIGDIGYQNNIQHLFDLSIYAEEKVKETPNLELLCPRTSLNICFRILPPEHIGTDIQSINTWNKNIRQTMITNEVAMVKYGFINEIIGISLILADANKTKKDIDDFFEILHKTNQNCIESSL